MFTQKKIQNLSEGKVDVGLIFVTGLFFLTIALAVTYFSVFRLTPLPKPADGSATVSKMPASAILATSNFEIVPIESPDSFTQKEAPYKEFFDSLPQTPVTEIFIGSYGVVDKEILVGVRYDIEKTFGVKTTLLEPGQAVPKSWPFYSVIHKQYDSDALLESIDVASAPYGSSVRFLYVVDLDMYSFDKQTRSSELYGVNPEANAGVISLEELKSQAGISHDIVLTRTKKLALHVLGVTLGFDVSPSAQNATCTTYPVSTTEDIDKQGSDLCDPEKEALSRIFAPLSNTISN